MAKTLTLVKRGKGYELFTDGKNKVIKFLDVRISFPACGEQKEDENEDGEKTKSWQVTPMLQKGKHDEAKAVWDEVVKELCAANPVKDKTTGQERPVKIAPENNAMKNGDEKDRPEYEGHWIVAASEKRIHPSVRTAQGDLLMNDSEIDKAFYGGCYANVMVRPWYFGGTTKNKPGKTFPKRICAGFTGIQFLREGDAFGEGRIDDTSAWGAAEGGGDDGLDGDDDI